VADDGAPRIEGKKLASSLFNILYFNYIRLNVIAVNRILYV